MKEFNRKIEFERKLYKIVNKYNLTVYGWEIYLMEALKIFKLQGENKEDMYRCTFCYVASKGKYNVKR